MDQYPTPPEDALKLKTIHAIHVHAEPLLAACLQDQGESSGNLRCRFGCMCDVISSRILIVLITRISD